MWDDDDDEEDADDEDDIDDDSIKYLEAGVDPASRQG